MSFYHSEQVSCSIIMMMIIIIIVIIIIIIVIILLIIMLTHFLQGPFSIAIGAQNALQNHHNFDLRETKKSRFQLWGELGWIARLCGSWLSFGKATKFPLGKLLTGIIKYANYKLQIKGEY